MSSLWTLNSKDVVNGLVIAILGAVLPLLQNFVSSGGDIFAYDWFGILRVAGYAAVVYLVKKFISTDNGKVFGKIG